MKLTELFSEIGEPFSYYPWFVHRFGISTNASVLLCFIGWKTFKDEFGCWKSFSVDGITKATGLSVKEQTTARKQLVDAGLIEEYYARLEHVLKFKILEKELTGVWPNAESADAQTPKGQMPIRRIGVSTKGQEGDNKEKEKTEAAFEAETELPQKQKSRKRELTDLWCAEFRKKHGWAYKFDGAKDGKAADRLLALGMDPFDLITIAKSAWNHPDWFNCKQAATIAGFECRYNDIRHELANPPNVRPVYQKPRVDIRQFKSGNF